jgi:hypothetical protein
MDTTATDPKAQTARQRTLALALARLHIGPSTHMMRKRSPAVWA